MTQAMCIPLNCTFIMTNCEAKSNKYFHNSRVPLKQMLQFTSYDITCIPSVVCLLFCYSLFEGPPEKIRNQRDTNICIKVKTEWHIVTLIGQAVLSHHLQSHKSRVEEFRVTLTEQI